MWDELNSSREHAATIESYDAEMAAIEYAEEDSDGFCDGIYQKGHPIMVECENGERLRYTVTAEPSVEYHARLDPIRSRKPEEPSE